MQELKYIEIRDRATLVPAVAFPVVPKTRNEQYIAGRAGFWSAKQPATAYVILMKLASMECQSDPYKWDNRRTMTTAHLWIRDNWGSIASGDVVDVEYVMGEVGKPKRSECQTDAE